MANIREGRHISIIWPHARDVLQVWRHRRRHNGDRHRGSLTVTPKHARVGPLYYSVDDTLNFSLEDKLYVSQLIRF